MHPFISTNFKEPKLIQSKPPTQYDETRTVIRSPKRSAAILVPFPWNNCLLYASSSASKEHPALIHVFSGVRILTRQS